LGTTGTALAAPALPNSNIIVISLFMAPSRFEAQIRTVP
jgi:hypothetical protein